MSVNTESKMTNIGKTESSKSGKKASVATGFETFVKDVGPLDEGQRKLLKLLYDINGQDAYDAEVAAVGRLRQEEYLVLPLAMELPSVLVEEVGKASVREKFSARHLAAVYTLNKERAPKGENAVMYGLIRMEAVKMGWVADQKEIIRVDFDDWTRATNTLLADLATAEMGTKIEQARVAAFLIPLVAEHVFRTYGHHYLSSQAAEYVQRYKDTFRACLREDVTSLLSAPNLYHHCLHWVSPARAHAVLLAQIRSSTIPDALVIRSNSAPSGTAIVATTAAVLEAMQSAGIYPQVLAAFNQPIGLVLEAAQKIKADVRKWHKAFYAYGVEGPSDEEIEWMNNVRQIAINFSPYAQGFIDGTLARAALGRAKALKKHADLNPISHSRALRFFRALGRKAVTNVTELFSTAVDEDEATG